MKNPRLSRFTALLPAALLFVFLAWKLEFLCDDAFISFRYGKNLAEGNGLVYNPTLDAPVEGYSNFLWVVWLSLLERLGWDVPLLARLSSALCALVLVLWVPIHARRRLALVPLTFTATALFAASLPPVAVWATGGLATAPTALAVFGVYTLLLGNPERPHGIGAGVFAALAGLVRADGAVWVLMILFAASLLWVAGGRPRALKRAILQAATIAFLCVGAHVAWRYGYYGDFLPNTAKVKGTFSVHRLERGLDYVLAYLLTVPTIALTLLLSLRPWRGGLASVWLTCAVVIAGTLGYGVWVGGDFMPMGRFLFPAVPFVPLLFAAAMGLFARQPRRVSLVMLGVSLFCVVANVLACFDLNPIPESVRRRFHFRQDRAWESELSMRAAMYERAMEWSLLGRAMATVVKPGESITTGPMGAIGYYTPLTVYDTYGLVSPSVIEAAEPLESSSPGHDVRVDDGFFLDREPTYTMGKLLAVDEEIPEGWKFHPFYPLVTFERHPLPEGQGLPEGMDLLLPRFHRWK